MDNRYGYGHIFIYINFFFKEKRVIKDLVQFFQAQLLAPQVHSGAILLGGWPEYSIL